MPKNLALRVFTMLALATPGPSLAADPIPVRTGNHPTYGRIVFDAPANTRYRLTREGDQISVRFPDDQILARPGSPPRNVAKLGVAGSRLDFTIRAGATIREMRLGERLVIDIADPPSGPRADEPPQRPTTPARNRANEGRPNGPARSATAQAPSASPTPADAPVAAPAAAIPATAPTPAARVTPSQPTITPPSPTLISAIAPPASPAPTAARTPNPQPVSTPSPPGPFRAADPAPASATAPAPMAAPRVPVRADPPVEPATDPQTAATPPPPQPPAPPMQLRATGPVLPAGPVALVVRRLPTTNPDQPAIVVPFTDTIGTAMVARDTATLVVFGERRPLDLAQLRDDPAFAHATAQLLPNATLLRIPLPEGRSASLTATPQGWRITLSNTSPSRPAITPVFADGRVTFPVPAPMGVVTLRDPDSGATLLVGTVGRGGEAITTERRTTEFTLPVTQRGVVVEALSDTLALRTVPTGFLLTGPPDGLALSPPATMTNSMLAAARLTRRFQFPAMPTEGLARRVNAHILEAASMPPLARGPARKVAAESLVALGMAAEAEALLRVIVEQDPKEAASTDTIILRAVAALLNGRTQAAKPLADPRAAGTDEDALWRALLLATRQEGSPEAAQILASTAPLLLIYPPALRQRLLPLAVETLVLGGSLRQAEELLAERPQDPTLHLARAFAHQARGETDAALGLLDEASSGRDQLVHARAAVRAVELRLATNALDVGQAAEALDRLLYAWRGDWRDLALRRRIAELRQHAGNWRAALGTLRDAAVDFPGDAARIRAWQQSAFAELVHGEALERMPPLELIGLVEENPDLLPADEGGDRLRDRLADRLLALDLPKRADPILSRLIETAPTSLGKAAYGTRLARLRSREGDAEGVLAALGQSSDPDLPHEMKEARLLLAAGAAARMGNVKGALNALNGIDSAAADEMRASVLEQSGDWAGAKRSLTALARRNVPVTGDLDDTQRRLVLRLATAAARAGDNATLAALRERDSARMGSGPLGDMFRLLTAEPVRGTSDLGRARQEAELVRTLPAGLNALAGARATP